MIRSTGFTPRTLSLFFTILLASVFMLPLVGCEAGATVIKGRVIAGPVGQSVGAAPRDERFENSGIPGVSVSILSKAGSASQGRGLYGSAVSDDFGNFELSIPNGQYPRDAIQVRVQGDGIFTSRSQTFLPPDGDHLLCVVITRPGYVIPAPPEDPKKKSEKNSSNHSSSGGE